MPARQLEADHASTNDDQVLWNFSVRERFCAGSDPRAVEVDAAKHLMENLNTDWKSSLAQNIGGVVDGVTAGSQSCKKKKHTILLRLSWVYV